MCSNTFGLLGGVLNGFLVRGLGWVTPMGMSVRLFEISLGETRIDIGNAIATQQIVFTSTPTGSARLVFNSADFGNLFRHPLMKKIASTAVQVCKAPCSGIIHCCVSLTCLESPACQCNSTL
jgi:hypothetical protein